MSIVAGNGVNTGLAGEFAVVSQLQFRGYDAGLTLGNTKGVDILVSNSDSGSLVKVEVKTRRTLKPKTERALFGPALEWTMGEKHETIKDPNLFYCFVCMDFMDDGKTVGTRFFIVPSNVVAEYVRVQHVWWLKDEKHNETDMRTFRLGVQEDFQYPVSPTPLAVEYEDRWDLL